MTKIDLGRTKLGRQTVKPAEGKTLSGLTEMTPQQRSLFAAVELPCPTPREIAKHRL